MKVRQFNSDFVQKGIFVVMLLLCLFPFVDPPMSLLAGILLAMSMGNPYLKQSKEATKYLLQGSVVGLGFGMNIYEAAEVGKSGLIFTVFSIVSTISIGLVLGRLLSTPKKTSLLISSGTAICGGSAIAAMTPVIDANEDETSVSLGIIFSLNSIALFIFPILGTWLNMTQEQFGLWAAIAIHDTSSVVGAAQKYGDVALKIATTVKLERALWIIPISLITAFVYKKNGSKIAIPYFIFMYVAAMLVNTFVPHIETIGPTIVAASKRGLTITLFLIGSGLSRTTLKTIGAKPLMQGILLWVFISILSLSVILFV